MANFYGQVCNFLSSLYQDGFPIFPITQVFFLSIIYWISSVLDESGNSGEESKFQQIFFYIIITVFLVFDCFLFSLNPDEAREWISAIGLPITTFIVAYFINKRQKDREIKEQQREKNREDNNRKQEILKSYLSEMSGLLKDQDIESIQPNSSVDNLCKAFTIRTLLELDSERNRLVTLFLTEMGITIENKNKWGLLKNTDLTNANFKRAFFWKVNFEKSILEKANLKGAMLRDANLKGAILFNSNFERANLKAANLEGVDLRIVKLKGTVLTKSILKDSLLNKANLEGAFLINSNLEKANLEKANLEGADLSEAINLKQEQIEQAKGDEMTKIPDYLKMPEHWKNTVETQDNVEPYDEKTNLT
ncbi:MAG: hypothetical protein GVY17_11205 [Cyanobacteria bacterium]|jgi:uncharacterized protein YjbI with pentapeptide repeats|nr:hypothetical protein [Cyanobacteria bacterium GSL.Bin21]